MTALMQASHAIQPMAPDAIKRVQALESELAKRPQVDVKTEHVLHAGMYARTITIPAGVALTGALIRVATVLIINGDTDVFVGGETKRLTGYQVLPASAGRKQAFYAYSDTQVTMVFPTKASTVEQAEDEFTEEAHKLLSRHQGHNHFQGDTICQEQ